MSKKLTFEEVNSIFESRGYVLLEKEYINANTKMKYFCKKHQEHLQSITTANLKYGKGCWYCSYEKRGEILKIPYDIVKEEFSKRGYELLSREYKGKHEKLEYLCPMHKNKILSISFHSLTNGHSGCPYCAGNGKPSIEEVKRTFEENGYELLENEYKNARSLLRYICLKHPEEVLKIRFSDLKNGQGCIHCATENRSGIGHPAWKGGISKLEDVLRHSIGNWKKEMLKKYQNKCFVTGAKNDLIIHHLVPFNQIVKKALDDLRLEKVESVNEYSERDINNLKERVVELHRNIEGVPLTNSVHISFHNEYGYKHTTFEQLIEFKNRY